MRKLILRTIKFAAVLFGLALVAVATSAWLACQEPAFYAELSSSQTPNAAIEGQLKQKQEALEQWARHRPRVGTTDNGTHKLEFTEQQLNSLVRTQRVGSVQDLRVKVCDGCIKAGTEVVVGERRFVIAVQLVPTIQNCDSLQLQIKSSQLGKLPLPTSMLLSALAKHVDLSRGKVGLELTGSSPLLTLDISGNGRRTIAVKSVECRPGSLLVVLEKPIAAEQVSQTLSDRQ